MNKILMLLALFILVPLAFMVLGVYYYGVWGLLAGLGLGVIFFKLVTLVIKKRFQNAMAGQMSRLQAESDLLKDAVCTLAKVEPTEKGKLLEGDEELARYYPRNYFLDVEVTTTPGVEWKPAGLRIEALYDEDLLNDEEEPDESGYGLYLYSVSLVENGAAVSVAERNLNTSCLARFHVGVGEKVERVSVLFHLNKLGEFAL